MQEINRVEHVGHGFFGHFSFALGTLAAYLFYTLRTFRENLRKKPNTLR